MTGQIAGPSRSEWQLTPHHAETDSISRELRILSSKAKGAHFLQYAKPSEQKHVHALRRMLLDHTFDDEVWSAQSNRAPFDVAEHRVFHR
jgi:hypothetical protein